MSIKSSVAILISIIVLFFTGSCSNSYMKKGSGNFEKITSPILGKWEIVSYYYNGKENIGSSFDSGFVSLAFVNDTASSVEVLLKVKEDYYKDVLIDASIELSNYSVLYSGKWTLCPRGITLGFNSLQTSLIIEGSGQDFNSFKNHETKCFTPEGRKKNESTKVSSNLGAFVSGIGVAVGAEKLSIYPSLSHSNNFKFEDDGNTLIIYSADNINLKLKKAEK